MAFCVLRASSLDLVRDSLTADVGGTRCALRISDPDSHDFLVVGLHDFDTLGQAKRKIVTDKKVTRSDVQRPEAAAQRNRVPEIQGPGQEEPRSRSGRTLTIRRLSPKTMSWLSTIEPLSGGPCAREANESRPKPAGEDGLN